MNRHIRVIGSFLLVTSAFLLTVQVAAAQDPAKVGPDIYKVVFENARVRVSEATFKPGAKIKMHSHPDHFVYPLAGGKLKITRPDGKSEEAEVQPGKVMWMAAETHKGQNVGESEVKLLVVELKEEPKK